MAGSQGRRLGIGISISISIGVVLILGGLAELHGQGITLSDATPRGIVPGGQTTVHFTGTHLADAELWLSCPGTAEPVALTEALPEKGDSKAWRIAIPAGELPGVIAVRAFSRRGFSDPLLLLVDPLPAAASTPSHTSGDASPIPVPSSVDATTIALKPDYYRFYAKARQKLTFEVVAQRFGSGMDPVLTLRNRRESELAFCDDDAALGGDARFEFTFDEAGEYLLEIHDVEFRPGLRYRLRVGDGNAGFSKIAFPPGARSGTDSLVTLNDRSGVIEPSVLVTSDPSTTGTRLVGTNHLSALVYFHDLPQAVECEPNDTPRLAMPVGLPVAINGRFDTAGDRDFYRFAVAEPVSVTITPLSATLGSPAACDLQLLDPQGVVIAATIEATATEAPLRFHAEPEKSYVLSVRDPFGRGGNAFVYHLLVETSAPPFALTLESADQLIAGPHTMARLQVHCARFGFDRPVQLSVVGLAEPFTLSGSTIDSGKDKTELRIHFPAGWTQDGWKRVEILGRASLKTREIQVPVRTQQRLRRRFPNLPTPPAGLSNIVFISPINPPICVTALVPSIALTPGAKALLTVAVTRKPGAEKPEPVRCTIVGLPPGLKQEAELTIPPDKTTGELSIVATDQADLTEATAIRIEATTRHLDQDLVIESGPVTLTVSANEEDPAEKASAAAESPAVSAND